MVSIHICNNCVAYFTVHFVCVLWCRSGKRCSSEANHSWFSASDQSATPLTATHNNFFWSTMADGSSSSSVSDPLDTRDDEGWEDAASDQEKIEIKSFFSDQIFPDAKSMIADCKKNNGFDFLDIRKKLGVYVFRFARHFLVSRWSVVITCTNHCP